VNAWRRFIPASYVGVVTPYKTACGKASHLSHRRFSAPGTSPLLRSALKSQTVRTDMKESHRHYQFGTFNERLENLCMLFEIAPPEIVYEDGEPTLTDGLMDWIKTNEVNMDWLFVGSPCAMLRVWAKDRGRTRRILEINSQLEPEVQQGLLALLKAVVDHNLPIADSMAVFDGVVKEFRAAKVV